MTPTATPAASPDPSREPDGGGRLKPSKTLRKARELLTPEQAWTKGSFARTAKGNIVGPNAEAAVCWCAAGAIKRCDAIFRSDGALRCLTKSVGGHIADWNDAPNRTHAEVLDAFDRAIVLAEADENARATPSPAPSGAAGPRDGGGANADR